MIVPWQQNKNSLECPKDHDKVFAFFVPYHLWSMGLRMTIGREVSALASKQKLLRITDIIGHKSLSIKFEENIRNFLWYFF